MKKGISVLALAFSFCLTATGVGRAAAPPKSAPVDIAGFYLPEPMRLQPFALLDHNGKAFAAEHLRNQWTLLFFGYTHCPDVCPTTLTEIRAVKKLLAAAEPKLKLSVAFVSIDPQRDTSAQLKQYVDQFGDDFIGLGGTPDQVDSFARQFKVKYAISGGTSTTYFIDHTSSVALLTPLGELRALFSAPLRPEKVAADVQRIAGVGRARTPSTDAPAEGSK